jgi:hypothetical protein
MSSSVDEIVKVLQDRVAERRAAGDYPFGLEAELEAEFNAILEMTHRGRDHITALDASLIRLRELNSRVSGSTPVDSRIPGGKLFHRMAERLVRRQVRGVANQVRDSQDETLRLLEQIVRQLEEQRLSDERLMNKMANSIMDRIAVVDQLAVSVVELERRLRLDKPRSDE